MITEIRPSLIRPSVMLNACVAGLAALLIGCSSSNGNPDPSQVSAMTQSSAAPAASPVTTFRAVKPGEKISASVYTHKWNGYNTGIAAAFDKHGLASLEACYRFGIERVYMMGDGGKITCTGEDEAPLARFVCNASTASCTSVLKF
jgi:hypothetical protein